MLFLVNAGWLVYLVNHVLSERKRFAEVFRGFDLEIPLLTRALLEVDDLGIMATGVALFLFLAVKELILPWRSIRFALNLATLVGLVMLIEFFYQAMTAPLIDLIENVATGT